MDFSRETPTTQATPLTISFLNENSLEEIKDIKAKKENESVKDLTLEEKIDLYNKVKNLENLQQKAIYEKSDKKQKKVNEKLISLNTSGEENEFEYYYTPIYVAENKINTEEKRKLIENRIKREELRKKMKEKNIVPKVDVASMKQIQKLEDVIKISQKPLVVKKKDKKEEVKDNIKLNDKQELLASNNITADKQNKIVEDKEDKNDSLVEENTYEESLNVDEVITSIAISNNQIDQKFENVKSDEIFNSEDIKKLKEMDENKYPVLKQYLNSKYNKQDKNNYSLDNLNLFNNVLNLINEEYSNKIPRDYAEKHKLKDLEIYKNNQELINDFIKLYNNLPKEANDKNLNLNIDNNHLCDFLLDENNKYGNSYKKIYIKFAKEQNKKLENLLDIKIERGIFDQNCKNRINIQQINEKEIFTMKLPKKVSFMNILFDSSYRKILDSEVKCNELYKEYEINYDLIEDNLTESLLKNKKLLNEDINTISSFTYNNEVFNNQVTDLITIFNKRYYPTKPIDLYNKVNIYKFSQDNKNSILCQDIINDFITLIKYLNDKKKENNNEIIIDDKTKENKEENQENKENDFKISKETTIKEVVNTLTGSFSNNFIKLFETEDNATIDKTSDIFTYYLKLNFDLVKEELDDYQENLDEESKKKIDNYYSDKVHTIKKEDFACAIRLFTTLVLFLEKDKEKKIKNNRNNLVNYLKASDLWRDIYDHPDFNKNLNELRDINVKISQIIPLYEVLGKDIKESDYDDVRAQIEKEKENEKEKESGDEIDNKSDKTDSEGGDSDDDDEFARKSDDDDDRD